jgi:PAS domain S-box-containing protein
MNNPYADREIFREQGASEDQEATLHQLRQRIEELKKDRDEYRRQAEKEATRRKYLESALQQVPDALVTLDASHRVVDWNLGAQRIFGYSRNEALGRDLDALINAPETEVEEEDKKQRLLSSHTVKAVEAIRYRKDSTPVRVLLSSAPITLQGTLKGVVTTYTDITERKREEEKLKERERGLRDLLNKAPVGVYQTDTERTPRFMSSEMASILGASSPKEAIRFFGDFASDLYADPDRRKELIRTLRRDGEVRNFEFQAKHLSGRRIWLSLSARIRKWLSRDTFLMDGFATDVTWRKESEEALLQKYREQSLLLDTTPVQLWYHTDVDTYGAANRAHADFLGRSGDELPNRGLDEFLPEENAYVCRKDNIEVFESGERIHTEEWIRNADGESRFLSLTKSPRLDEQNNVECVVCSALDITERKHLEERLKETSFYDPTTGLYNNAFFEEEMHRLGKDRYCPMGIIVCRFEGRNSPDSRPSRGEDVSLAAAGILRRSFRSSDILARIGTNAFAVLQPQINRDILQKCCTRIEREVENFHEQQNGTHSLTLWTGWAVRYNPPVNMSELLRRADQSALEKKSGHSAALSRCRVDASLIKTQMARDLFSKGQGEGSRLQEYTLKLGTALGLSETRLHHLSLLARFHDLGKVGVPDRILFKTGRLCHAEFQVMKRHCEIGHRIALSSSSLAPIADFILKHHEWWDGRGYPLGLQGKAIPLECRILSITEAYEAMTADRPYRGAMSREEAVREIRRCAGTQFDPYLVEQFIGLALEEASRE